MLHGTVKWVLLQGARGSSSKSHQQEDSVVEGKKNVVKFGGHR